ncbi:MAG: hypothetical protein Hyperionvirus22_14 [Hyperionvirus sp.]|uniref:Uncharacterized protein n=1 Tax=Hyperionvirus sp. TaxID=2487770 RepID=A0A3G5AEK6_9VIRU|nr:MAG: hypothetical protein Hyperionvirus22_14 [Hyperionvirus sp.]
MASATEAHSCQRVGRWTVCDSILDIGAFLPWMVSQFTLLLARSGVEHTIVNGSWFVHEEHFFREQIKAFCDKFYAVLGDRRVFLGKVSAEIARYVWDYVQAIKRPVERSGKGPLTLIKKFELEATIRDELKKVPLPSITWKPMVLKKPDGSVAGNILCVNFPLGRVFLSCERAELLQFSTDKITDPRELNLIISRVMGNAFLQGVRSKEELLPNIANSFVGDIFLSLEEAYGFYGLVYGGPKQVKSVARYEYPLLEIQAIQNVRIERYMEMLSAKPAAMALREIFQALNLDFFKPSDGMEIGKRVCAGYDCEYPEKKHLMVNGELKAVNVYYRAEYLRIVGHICRYLDEIRRPEKMTCYVFRYTILPPDIAGLVGVFLLEDG